MATGIPETYSQFNEAGEIMWAMHQYATRQEKENEELRAENRRLRTLLQSAQQHCWIGGDDTLYTLINAALREGG